MKATIIIHQGWADLFSNNGLLNYYANMYDELIIFTIDNNRKKLLEVVFKNNNKIKIEMPQITNNYNGIDTCLNCMTLGNSNCCPRDNHILCKYINYNNYKDNYENIKIGAFNNYNLWHIFKTNKYLENISFSHCFYLYNNIDIYHRINNFKIHQNLEIENNNYNNYTNLINKIGDKYIVVHEDNDRGFIISNNLNNNTNNYNNLPIYNLDKKSIIMIDQISIIENAEELHLIDSSDSVLIYYLCFDNIKLQNKKIYLYSVNQNRDLFIYKNPTYDNWIFM